jgi:hypothetical protein
LDLQFIEPELREGRDEIKRAAKRELPNLVVDKDLHGILHCHTTASDGTETLETMAEATRNAVSSISASQIIRNRLTTPAVSRLRKSLSSTARPIG